MLLMNAKALEDVAALAKYFKGDVGITVDPDRPWDVRWVLRFSPYINNVELRRKNTDDGWCWEARWCAEEGMPEDRKICATHPSATQAVRQLIETSATELLRTIKQRES